MIRFGVRDSSSRSIALWATVSVVALGCVDTSGIGHLRDAGTVSVPGDDAGTTPPMDAGSPGFDAGPTDSGFDSGRPPVPELCNGVDDDCDGETDEDACNPGFDCDWERYEGHVYVLCRRALRWGDARNLCRIRGYDLVKIESSGEDAFLDGFIQSRNNDTGGFWIGLSKGDFPPWRWSDGSSFDLDDFADIPMGEGLNAFERCFAIRAASRNWHDFDCGNVGGFICEAPYQTGSSCL